ncbi:MAG: FeoB small GTPase domain-containing protein [bacterium]
MEKNCQNCQIIKKIKNYKKIDYTVVLVGNPNVGKSTLFNFLTGMNVKVGNWPGKTVTKIEGFFEFKIYDQSYVFKLIDSPGVYSLFSFTPEEEVTRNFLFLGNYDIVIMIFDATNMEKNMILAFQVFEITDKIIIALNLIDEAKRRGINIDIQKLEQKLNVPVVPIIAQTGYNIDSLLIKSLQVIKGEIIPKPIIYQVNPEIQKMLEEIQQEIAQYYPDLANNPKLLRWLSLRMLEGDKFIIELVKNKAIIKQEFLKTPNYEKKL